MTAHDTPSDDLASFLLGRGFVAVPLRVNAVGHFELAAEVNGQGARLVLDTGASHTVFATSSVEHFGLQTTPSPERAQGVSDHATSAITVADLLRSAEAVIDYARATLYLRVSAAAA